MFRKSAPMQAQWDEQIRLSRLCSIEEHEAADNYDTWAARAARHRVTRRLAYPLRNKAADIRDRAAENFDIAQRMETCSYNPRNGGPGFFDPPRPTPSDLFFLLTWLVFVFLPGLMAAGAIVATALHRHPSYTDSPMILIVGLAALLIGTLTMAAMASVLNALIAAGHLTADIVRGIGAHAADVAAWVRYVRTP